MEFYTSVERKGNRILYRGIKIDESASNDVFKAENFSPTLYVRSSPESATHRDFYDGYVREKTFQSAREMNDFIKLYGDIPNEIWGNKNIIPQFIYNKFGKTIEYQKNKIRGAIIDIEVMTRQKINDQWIDGGFPNAAEAKFPINAICQYDTETGIYNMYTLAKWEKTNSCYPELAEKIKYIFFNSERELLIGWINSFRRSYPHYISGWNIEKFDIPYIINRINAILGDTYASKLSPWNHIESHTINTMYGEEIIYTIYGIPTLDYLDLYKKHVFVPRESYSLDFIAECELGEHKKEFKGTHGTFFWEDPQGFVDYNAKDVNLVVGINDKLQLIDLVISLAYFAGINYVETFSPIRTWDTLIYRECMNRGIAIPLNDEASKREEYEGAYVFPTKNGMYKAIASFDVASMYPNCNRSWNIGSDTILNGSEYQRVINELIIECKEHNNSELESLIKYKQPFVEYYKDYGMPEYITNILKQFNVCLTPNWQFFRTDKESIFTKLQADLYFGRKADKKQAQEYAQKEKDLHEKLVVFSNETDEYQNILQQYNEAKHMKVVYNTSQQVKKILLNN